MNTVSPQTCLKCGKKWNNYGNSEDVPYCRRCRQQNVWNDYTTIRVGRKKSEVKADPDYIIRNGRVVKNDTSKKTKKLKYTVKRGVVTADD